MLKPSYIVLQKHLKRLTSIFEDIESQSSNLPRYPDDYISDSLSDDSYIGID